MATVSINLGDATITVEQSSLGEPFFTVILPSSRQYQAGSITGVVNGAQNIRDNNPEAQDVAALNQIISSFAQQEGPAMVADLVAALAAAPEQTSVDSSGAIATNAETARDNNASTQNPPVETAIATEAGTVVTPPDTVTTTNAAPATGDAASGGVLPAPGSLPNNTTSSAGNVAASSVAPATTISTPVAPNNTNSLINTFGTSSATQSYIYRAIKVTHYFKGGKFTQQLNGSLVIYDVPEPVAGAPGTLDPQQRAETERPVVPGPLPREDLVVPTPPETSNPSTPGTDAGAPPDDSAPFTPGETEPPTSGNENVAPPSAPTPPSSITVAGATLQASLQTSGRVFILLTLPSGRSEINVDGWGDEQWDGLLYSVGGLTDTRDIAAAEIIKASWLTLQAQLRASVQTPAAVAAPSQNMAKEP